MRQTLTPSNTKLNPTALSECYLWTGNYKHYWYKYWPMSVDNFHSAVQLRVEANAQNDWGSMQRPKYTEFCSLIHGQFCGTQYIYVTEWAMYSAGFVVAIVKWHFCCRRCCCCISQRTAHLICVKVYCMWGEIVFTKYDLEKWCQFRFFARYRIVWLHVMQLTCKLLIKTNKTILSGTIK